MSSLEDEQSALRQPKGAAVSTRPRSPNKKLVMTDPDSPTAKNSSNTMPERTSESTIASQATPRAKTVIHDQPGYTKEEVTEHLNKLYGTKWLDWEEADLHRAVLWAKLAIDRLKMTDEEPEAQATAAGVRKQYLGEVSLTDADLIGWLSES